MTRPPETQPEPVAAKVDKQERGAVWIAIVTVILISVVGAPCFCYFGFGLVQGIHTLQSGESHNPARQRRGAPYKRAPRHERVYPSPDVPGNVPP